MDYDYFITAICYGDDKSHITYVKVQEYIAKTKKINLEEMIVPRDFIAKLIKNQEIGFYTATWNQGTKKWDVGSRVSRTKGGFIRSDANDTEEDNLEELPEFYFS